MLDIMTLDCFDCSVAKKLECTHCFLIINSKRKMNDYQNKVTNGSLRYTLFGISWRQTSKSYETCALSL